MTKYEMILMAWNVALTVVIFTHMLRFALIQRVLHTIMNIELARRQKQKIDNLYGRD